MRRPPDLPQALLLAALALFPANGNGCGPDFPDMFSNALRQQKLLLTPPSLLSREIRKLAPSPRRDMPLAESLVPADNYNDSRDGLIAKARAAAETQDLSPEQAALLQTMRSRSGGDAAYLAGAGLPEDIRLYTAAAVDFHRAQPEPAAEPGTEEDALYAATPVFAEPAVPDPRQAAALAAAAGRFDAVLKLAATDRSHRTLWATYMLGRVNALQGQRAAAAAYFGKTREQVRAGAADPLGLGVASLGEEARLHLRPGELAQAAALYAEQLAYGSATAENSLRRMAYLLTRNAAYLDEALASPLLQRLLFMALYCSNTAEPFRSFGNEADLPQQPSTHIYGAPPPADPNQLAYWQKITDAVAGQGAEQVAGADWLAAHAYNLGQFEMAGQLLQHPASPLAYWLKAKLALHDLDYRAALAAYAQAIAGFQATAGAGHSPGDGDEQTSPLYILYAEQATLHLGHNEFMPAMRLFYQAADHYWQDAAYVAERVLTTAELQKFVDDLPAPVIAPGQPAGAQEKLRALLARRLLREGHGQQAVSYFDQPELASLAGAYLTALQQAASPWRSRIDRARDWFAAARIAREHGMELLGFELAPDAGVWQGAFPYYAEPAEPDGVWLGTEEIRRLRASQADPYLRFHYRGIAAEYAANAADLLPPRSQAFAAVLCAANGWLQSREPALAEQYYRRYLEQGAYVAWGGQFGRQCPEPDFARARISLLRQTLGSPAQPGPLGILAGLLAAGMLAGIVRRLRRTRKAGPG